MVDCACLLASLLFLSGSIIEVIITIQAYQSDHFDYDLWTALDPSYLQEEWKSRLDRSKLVHAMGFLKALGWFSLCIPVMQMAWILSNGGRRRVALHSMMVILVLGGSVTEVAARLMTAGLMGVSEWISSDFELDQWLDQNSVEDFLGWRVLEVAHLMNVGLMAWIDAFEWLALSILFISIFISVWSYNETDYTFGRKWAAFGLFIGILSFFDFLADVLRYRDWVVFMQIAAGLSVINTIIFLPIWLLILGIQIQPVREYFENGGYNNRKGDVDDVGEGAEGEGNFLSES